RRPARQSQARVRHLSRGQAASPSASSQAAHPRRANAVAAAEPLHRTLVDGLHAFVESFNGKFRDECLDDHWFASVPEARTLIEAWRIDYNTVRPHSALDGQTPHQFARFSVGARRLSSARTEGKETKNEEITPEDLSLSV